MITIKIDGMDELKNALNDVAGKQIPFAAAQAITRTAKAIEQRIQSDMAGAFKSASPFVKRATFSTSANKVDLTAMVGLKDQKPSGGTAPAVLLKEHFTGGLRGNKPFEKALIALGVMKSGYRAVPGRGIKLDAYGNPSRKDIGKMLGSLRSRMQIFKGRGRKAVLVGFFVVLVGSNLHLHPGIYKRNSRGEISAMFLFVQHASYRKIIDIEGGAREVVAREFQPNFDSAFAEAMGAAR
jgi:hypothetical protein